jgi:hypothetical protein
MFPKDAFPPRPSGLPSRIECRPEVLPFPAHPLHRAGRGVTVPQGDKSSYTGKQKRRAEHIEEGYKKKGVSTEGRGEPQEKVGRHEEARQLQPGAQILVALKEQDEPEEEEVTPRPDDPIAADVEEAYRESDLSAARARERADRAQDNADRSGQGEEGAREEEKGVGTLEDRDGR